MTLKAGDRIPSINVTRMGESGPEPVSTDDIFGGRKVVMFAVPGAFTPTCSAQHLPGYVSKADEIRAKGVDTIACLSVNDVFVMDAWGRSQNAGGKVEMLADGSGELTRALGTVLDLTERGLGVRSARYAVVVEDGVVTHANMEEGGGLEVSGAETVLGQL